MKKLVGIIAGALLLAGCSSSAESKEAECSYYWDAANVVLTQWYEWHLIYPPAISLEHKKIVEEQLYDDWALRVLEAPSGCFPDSDINKAKQFVG
jgi:hypothetical protein